MFIFFHILLQDNIASVIFFYSCTNIMLCSTFMLLPTLYSFLVSFASISMVMYFIWLLIGFCGFSTGMIISLFYYFATSFHISDPISVISFYFLTVHSLAGISALSIQNPYNYSLIFYASVSFIR